MPIIVGNSPNYQNTFGQATVPAAGFPYQQLTLAGNLALNWPYNYTGQGNVISKLMDVTCPPGITLSLPDAMQISTGEDFLIRNVGSNSLSVLSFTGTTVATVAAGAVSYFYVTNNSTQAGTYGVVAFGVGTASLNAAAIAGQGLAASGALLNTAVPMIGLSGSTTITALHLAALLNYTGSSSGAVAVTSAVTLGANFYCSFHNSSTVTATLTPAVGTIDGSVSFQVQPGESLMLICDGSNFYTVGYGRSVAYQFTQQVLNISGGVLGVVLTPSQAASKMLKFTGTSTGGVSVQLPGIAGIYYVINATTAIAVPLTFTTGAVNPTTGVITGGGANTVVPIGGTTSVICDGTNMYTATSTASVSGGQVSLLDGSTGTPGVNFSNETTTGLYRVGAGQIGVSILGVNRGTFSSSGFSGAAATAATVTTAAQPAITSVGTLTGLTVSTPISGSVTGSAGSCTGNAATVTNGIYTTNISSYAPGLTGSGASGSWGISVTGSSTSCSGNANSSSSCSGNAAGVSGVTLQAGLGTGNSPSFVDVTITSDERLKTNWRELPAGIVEGIAQLKRGVYDRIDSGTTQVGVSAQSLQAVLPEAVSADDNGFLHISQSATLALLAELSALVMRQDARITELEARI